MHYRKWCHKYIAVLIFCAVIGVTYSCSRPDQPLEFPFDHGPHFDVVNEWWYFTGEVETEGGKTLGFECAIFKRLVPTGNDFAYLGHLAVSDPETSQHFFAEVATLPPVAGIEEGKTEIAVNSFYYRFSEPQGFTIKAAAGNLSVDLSLTPVLEVLPHGEDGSIIMGDGKPSYYYSFTHLSTTGTISVNGSEYAIAYGRTWMDHQWGNFTVLGMKWDWFSLRLDDGGALMLFHFRDAFDRTTRTNWTYQSGAGKVEYGKQFSLQAARIYKEESGHSAYPVDWTIEVPDLDGVFKVTPLFDAQSLYDVMTPDYWEGLCSVEGTLAGEKAAGSAYVELTGYEDKKR